MRALLIAAGLLIFAASAEAHTLTIAGAERTALRRALAQTEDLSDRPALSVIRSTRRSQHMVDVRVRFVFDDVRCSRTLRVRFTSTATRRTRVSFPDRPVCF